MTAGLTRGKVRRQKRCQPLAPSTLAASESSAGMLCSAPRITTVKNGYESDVDDDDGGKGRDRVGEPGHAEVRAEEKSPDLVDRAKVVVEEKFPDQRSNRR